MPSRPEAHLKVIGATGERQSRRYAELFVVALKGACESDTSATLASQGRAHEVQDLRKDGQKNANHDGRLRVTISKIRCFENVHAVEARNTFV